MYPALGQLRVFDAMHPGLISCSPDMPLRTVARMMATYRVHAILVTAHGAEELPGGSVWGVISDADLLRAAQAGDLDEQAARTIAATPVLTVTVDEELVHAALGIATESIASIQPFASAVQGSTNLTLRCHSLGFRACGDNTLDEEKVA